jgi:large subunit ribosomal protein L2
MGKRIKAQRRGDPKSPTFRAPKLHRKGAVKYPGSVGFHDSPISGEVISIEHESGRYAPLAQVQYTNGIKTYIIAPEGIAVGEEIKIGSADIKLGNTLSLKDIPEGTSVYNLEIQPGDGGKLVRCGGTYATVVTRSATEVIIKLPSGKVKSFRPLCRATIGVVAGGGRVEKPFVKAGNKFYHTRAKNQFWPSVRGVAMVAAMHPHGGGRHKHIKKGSAVARNTPPGAKVGLIAASRTGRRKR